MRIMIAAIALMMGLIAIPHGVLAQSDGVPVPPARERPLEDAVVIEELKTAVAAEEPARVAEIPVKRREPVAEDFVDSTPELAPVPAEHRGVRAAGSTVALQVPPLEVRGDASEAELAERVAVIREQYRLTLQALKQVYVKQNNMAKLRMVDKELEGLAAVDKPQYLSEVEIAPVNLVARDSIAAADQLFKEGMDFKNYPAWPDEKRGKLRIAVEKFTTLIREYPTSDKISEAAFRLGEIYEGWYYEDFAKAAAAYERAYQWNPRTILPAKFRAARLYDEKLMQRDKAVILYKQVVVERLYRRDAERAARRVIELSGGQ